MKTSEKNIIWLASYPKSGNTWIRIFLQSLLGNDEKKEGFSSLSDIPIASNRNLIDQYLGVNSSDLTDDEINNLRPEVYKEFSKNSDQLQVLKVHDAFSRSARNQPLFPPEVTHSTVYIIRNPLDIVVSYAFHSNITIDESIERLNNPDFAISGNEFHLKAQVNQFLGSWSHHVNSWIDQNALDVVLIRYEDLLSDCRQEFKKLLNKIDINYVDALFENAIQISQFDQLRTKEQKHGFREKPIHATAFFREGKMNSFRKFLNKDQIKKVLSRHQSTMEKFGYSTSIK